MSGLEVALIILISIWSIIFIVIALGVFLIFLAIKRVIDKANKLLDQAEDIADRVNLPSKVVIASILAYIGKNSAGGIKNLIGEFFKSRPKKK